MAKTATYTTSVQWKGDHWGHIVLGNGPQMMFSAPPDAYGQGLRAASHAEAAEASPAGLARSETGQSRVDVPAQLMDIVRLYNTIPAEDDAVYTEAVAIAWQSYCAAKEQSNG